MGMIHVLQKAVEHFQTLIKTCKLVAIVSATAAAVLHRHFVTTKTSYVAIPFHVGVGTYSANM